MPKINVIFPTHNRLEWLKESIASVLSQDVDLGLYILDNGSSDGTFDYLTKHSDPRIKAYHRADNQRGGYGLLTRLMGPSRYLVLWSDDDIMYPGSLRKKAEMLDAHPKLGMVFSPVTTINASGAFIEPPSTMGRISPDDLTWGGLGFYTMIQGDYIPTPTAMLRTSVFSKWYSLLWEQDLELCDWALWLEAAHAGVDSGFLAEDTIYYRQHDKSDTAAFSHDRNKYVDQHLQIWRHWYARGWRPTPPQVARFQEFLGQLGGNLYRTLIELDKILNPEFHDAKRLRNS